MITYVFQDIRYTEIERIEDILCTHSRIEKSNIIFICVENRCQNRCQEVKVTVSKSLTDDDERLVHLALCNTFA